MDTQKPPPNNHQQNLPTESPAAASSACSTSYSHHKERLARIQTRRVLCKSTGDVQDPFQIERVLLVILDPIDQILLEACLQEEGYQVHLCPQLHQLPTYLHHDPPPSVVVVDAILIAQQVPYFRKTIIPLLAQYGLPYVITGVNPLQQERLRGWYSGPLISTGDICHLLQTIRDPLPPP